MTFQELGLCPEILRALAEMDYETPSPIQGKAIPPALAGRDVLGCAQTGTGKTCAFATPILQRLSQRPDKARPIRALILTPTRELALQIQENFEFYGKNLPLRSAVIFGGVGQQPQVDKLKAGVDILVATPGRLLDLHDQGFIHVEKLEIFVLDEADRMLDMGFIHDVKKILKWLPKKKQTLFFSATMPPEVQGLVDSLLVDPVKVAVDPISSPVEVIRQSLYYVDRGNKSKLLAQLIRDEGAKNALIFTRTKHGANKVAGDLCKAGIPAAAIHGNKSQTARQQALADFKAGRIRALVATDIAARGIDIEELSHVFNYNLPDVPETYVHRIGRTGRAGHEGTAISFCEFGEKELLAPIEKLLKRSIPVAEGHPYPMVNLEAPKRDKHGKIVNADDAEARQAARERKAARNAAKQSQAPKKQPQKTPETPAQAPVAKGPFGGRFRDGAVPQKASRSAQTAASGKRASAGYKPSKTLDEALAAMSPKPVRSDGRRDAHRPERPVQSAQSASPFAGDAEKQKAFERWMAEERAIQAKKGYHDPLAGETVMDATARLLSPKGTTPEPKRQPRQETPRRDSAKRQRREEKSEQRRQDSSRRAAKSEPRKSPRQDAAKGGSRKQERTSVARPAPQTPAKPTREERRPQRQRRGRGPMEVTLNLGSQKDSTEQQGSLMKPYYFNPDEN